MCSVSIKFIDVNDSIIIFTLYSIELRADAVISLHYLNKLTFNDMLCNISIA